MAHPRFRKHDDIIVLVRDRVTGTVHATRGSLTTWSANQRNERVRVLGDIYVSHTLPGPINHKFEMVERPVPGPKPKRVPMTPEERKERRKKLREQRMREAAWDAEEDEYNLSQQGKDD